MARLEMAMELSILQLFRKMGRWKIFLLKRYRNNCRNKAQGAGSECSTFYREMGIISSAHISFDVEVVNLKHACLRQGYDNCYFFT